MTTTKRLLSRLAVGVLAVGLSSACAPPPKVLVDAAWLGKTRTAEMLIRRNETGKFDQFLRICNIDDRGERTACKDTLILSDVTPGSLY